MRNIKNSQKRKRHNIRVYAYNAADEVLSETVMNVSVNLTIKTKMYRKRKYLVNIGRSAHRRCNRPNGNKTKGRKIMNLNECIKYMSERYFDDTVILIDMVLCDDITDPQYSVITTLNRFLVYLQYKNIVDKDYKCSDIASALEKIGYTKEDISLLKEKAKDEYKIYIGEVLCTEFINS